MVMTFVLTSRLTITLSLSLVLISFFPSSEGFSIDFPSHMIESVINCYCDTTTRDKLIFPLAIMHILIYMHITVPPLLTFMSWVPLVRNLFGKV